MLLIGVFTSSELFKNYCIRFEIATSRYLDRACDTALVSAVRYHTY